MDLEALAQMLMEDGCCVQLGGDSLTFSKIEDTS